MTRELFVFEGRRLLRNPLPWVAAVFGLAVFVFVTWDWAPDLTVDTVDLAGCALFLAAAVLLAANLATSRDGRHGMPETLAAMPGRAIERTRAVAAASIVVGAALAAALIGTGLAVRTSQGPVAGRFDLLEALAGIVTVALAAAAGVALGRWLPGLIMGPVVILTLAMVTLLNRNLSGIGGWFLPLVLHHGVDWPPRPSATHLAYLAACVVLFTAVALLCHRARPVRLVVTLAAAAVAALSGTIAASSPEVNLRSARPGPDGSIVDQRVRDRYFGPDAYRCESRDGVAYCAFPEYVAWIPRWAAAVGPIARAVPPAARSHLPVVRQQPASWTPSESVRAADRSAHTWMVWGVNAAEHEYRNWLAGDVAAKVVGLGAAHRCDARGQARTIIALWLLGQTTGSAEPPDPVTLQASPMTRIAKSTLLGQLYGPVETAYARRLLATPDARERIWANWPVLLDSRTTIEQALPLFGLRPEFPLEQPGEPPCT
jgi:hypothetical protein